MATSPQSLLGGSACINNFGPGGFPLMEIELLSQWATALNPSASTNPAVLLANAACYNNYSAQSWLLKLGLLKNIILGIAPTMLTDPQFLLFADGTFCYNNYGPGTFPLLDIALLTDIVLQKNPAANTNPASLLAGSGCYNNYSAQSWLVKLGLLQEISQSVNPSAPTDAASLLSAAMCYNCYGPGIWPLLEVQLLNLIFTNGGVTPASSAILLETGGYILLETGGKILLEA